MTSQYSSDLLQSVEHTSTYVAFICQLLSPVALAFASCAKLCVDCIEYRVGVRSPDDPLRFNDGGPESFLNSIAAARGMTPGSS